MEEPIMSAERQTPATGPESPIPVSRELVEEVANQPLGAPESPLVLLPLTQEDAQSARIVRNARVMLDALAEGPQPLTKKRGLLNRKFVRRMAEQMEFDEEFIGLRLTWGSLDEDQVWPLFALRHVLRIAGLSRTLHGKALITKKGEQLRSPEHASALYSLLFITYFTRYNIASSDLYPVDDSMQDYMGFTLLRVGTQLRTAQPIAEFAAGLPHDEMVWASGGLLAEFGVVPDWQLHGALRRRVLEPLVEFGLLSYELPPEPADQRRRWSERGSGARWSVTPLFDRLVALRVGEDLVDLAHVELPHAVRRREPVSPDQWLTVPESIERFARTISEGDPDVQRALMSQLAVLELSPVIGSRLASGDTRSPVERVIRFLPSTVGLAEKAWGRSGQTEMLVTALVLYVSWCIDEGQVPEEVGVHVLEVLQPYLPTGFVLFGGPSMN
jgi:hypothetical protein